MIGKEFRIAEIKGWSTAQALPSMFPVTRCPADGDAGGNTTWDLSFIYVKDETPFISICRIIRSKGAALLLLLLLLLLELLGPLQPGLYEGSRRSSSKSSSSEREAAARRQSRCAWVAAACDSSGAERKTTEAPVVGLYIGVHMHHYWVYTHHY